VNFVDGPGHLEVPAGSRIARAADGSAEAFEQRLLTGFDDHERRRKNENRKLAEDNPEERTLEKLEEPSVRNLEAELVIERVRRSGEEALRLREQTMMRL